MDPTSPLSPRFPRTGAVVAALRAGGCVFAEDEAELLIAGAGTPDELDTVVDRRVAGEPLEQILGWAEFCGIRIAIDPGVFVPRTRTEFLVERATALLPARGIAVDLCCGSGAVARALADRATPGELHAADLDPAACACAERNLAGRAEVHRGDLFAALPANLRGRVDVLVANVPYVPTEAIGTLPPESRLYEPLLALDGGADGLDIARRIAAGAPDWLAPGGALLFETNERQAETAVAVVDAAGLHGRIDASDDWGTTVITGRLG